ncbi:sensor histidine kinase [Sphingomonas jeddahensis]|uniref:histidine kinase n=1 Tax=Sphingomonas jeddahensis TaxID=1915074 RepID=A0A1V2EWH0_9SPHN|nr:PAS domain-containing protein [Sphingomonas jeddahensis]ONF97022.1 Blue-light-activated histidine kinase [Sphingomonas jeddahensis]
MARPAGDQGEQARLLDENEQLRASLESALEENAGLAEERDRLRQRMSDLSQELRLTQSAVSQQAERTGWLEPAYAQRGQTEEELRVAFEELQVLTEELEVANTDLHQTNRELDTRVEQRTRQLKEINEALQTTGASLRAVADLVPELLWRTDARGKADWFNQRWTDYTGEFLEQSLGLGWLEALHPRDKDVARTAWSIAIGSGKPFQHEFRIRDAAGEYRWFLVRAEPLTENGRILRWFAAGTDIHGQRMTMEALQRSELRFRTLIEGIPQLVWRAVGGGQWTWSSPQWSAYTGQDETEARGLGWLDAFHPDDRAAATEAWERAQDSGRLDIEGRIFHAPEERYRHFRTRALRVRDEPGRAMEWLGTSTDVDDILQLQEAQSVLVAELQHRTRNLMAVVQAVTTRTLRGAASLEQFAACIDDRFSALARVQSLLSRRETGTRVPFDLLLRDELSAHVELDAAAESGKVTLEGPPRVPLRSATIQTFALALHELATNAVKYGALASADGRLRVRWGVRRDEPSEPRLWVDWRESGVSDMPGSDTPARGGGYGRELIERALPYQLGARTSYRFEPDGVHCTIEMPVPAETHVMEKADG